MILLDDLNIITSFSDYLKYGLVGLSAIVLILTYFLLFKEQSRRHDVRENMLNAIKRYMWTSLIFLIISGTWSILEKKPQNPTNSNNDNTSYALDISISPDSTMKKIAYKDSLIVRYREKKTATTWCIAPVTKGTGVNLIATLANLSSDKIYQVQLYNVDKDILWENQEEISVRSSPAPLHFKNH